MNTPVPTVVFLLGGPPLVVFVSSTNLGLPKGCFPPSRYDSIKSDFPISFILSGFWAFSLTASPIPERFTTIPASLLNSASKSAGTLLSSLPVMLWYNFNFYLLTCYYSYKASYNHSHSYDICQYYFIH